MPALISRKPQRALAVTSLVVVAVLGGSIWLAQSGHSAAAPDVSIVKASRGDLVVSVGGVGRIVTGGGASAIEVPSGASSGTTTSGSAGNSTSAPAGAVFARVPGHVDRLLVKAGQHVAAGQPLARLEDDGALAAALHQAQLDLATARIELDQKLHNDPQKGTPPTVAEIAAAQDAVTSARADLAQTAGRAHTADVVAARADVRRGQADLQALLGGTRADRRRALTLAQSRVTAAQKRLERVLAPGTATDISAAQAEVKKAEADLAVLQKAPSTPLPEDITAAQFAVSVAQGAVAAAQAQTPVDPAAVSAAQLELDKALAALAALKPPLAQEIASAQAAADAARTKLAALQGPGDAADVAAARQELAAAQAEVRALRSGPSGLGRAAARAAVASARAKLTQAEGPAATIAARSAVSKAVGDLAALNARKGPASASDIALARLKYQAAAAKLAAARLDLRHLVVRAPSAGTVNALLTAPGAPVDGATAIVSVMNLTRLAVRVDLSEFDVARVKSGLGARVSVDALGGKAFPGRVVFTAVAGTDKDGVVTFPVTVSLKGVHGPRPGMNVSVRIIVAQRHDVVEVPLDAVSRDEDGATVAVVGADGKSSTRVVKLGLANNKSVEIVQGLRAGERVAIEASAGPEE
ncbi:MAG: HlyD family secretion protein, partial [Gaiellales bacterium]|nr:HlyD family secretion protein [Gaiellales bacterium]